MFKNIGVIQYCKKISELRSYRWSLYLGNLHLVDWFRRAAEGSSDYLKKQVQGLVAGNKLASQLLSKYAAAHEVRVACEELWW